MTTSSPDRKVKRLLKSEQPKLMNIKDAQIDLSYQRPPAARLPLLTKIANKFSWAKFGVILLYKDEDGTLWIIDGAGRWYIIYTLLGLDCEIPCVVVTDKTIKERAELFVDINRDQKHPNSGDIFKARVAMEEPMAVAIYNIATQLGLTVGQKSGPDNIASVQSLEFIFQDGDNLAQVLAIKKNEWAKDTINGGLLEGVDLFLRAVPFIDLPAFRRVLHDNPMAVTMHALTRKGGGEAPLKHHIGHWAAVYWAGIYNTRRKIRKASIDRINQLGDPDLRKAAEKAAKAAIKKKAA